MDGLRLTGRLIGPRRAAVSSVHTARSDRRWRPRSVDRPIKDDHLEHIDTDPQGSSGRGMKAGEGEIANDRPGERGRPGNEPRSRGPDAAVGVFGAVGGPTVEQPDEPSRKRRPESL